MNHRKLERVPEDEEKVVRISRAAVKAISDKAVAEARDVGSRGTSKPLAKR